MGNPSANCTEIEFGDLDFDDENPFDGGLPPVGKHHFQLVGAEEAEDYVDLKFATCHSSVAGCTITHRVNKLSHRGGDADKKIRKRYVGFALILGATTKQKMEAARQSGRLEIDWPMAVGNTCVAEVIEENYTDKSGNQKVATKLAWSIWRVNDPAIGSTLINEEIERSKSSGGPAPHGGQQSQPVAQTKPHPPHPPQQQNFRDKYGDI